ncbi:MAG: Type 1 glutamine amidotransferase-like domain-containing protein [Lachnospiraceae bacterium]|nr:Type 1 glutamine amidotransferase-like domain-containing protein [Lachnospiraceae bacterium]
MGRLVAVGGGAYEEIDAICAEIVCLSGKTLPNVLFIGTALKDSTNPLTSCKKTFKRCAPGCIVKKLSIIRSQYTEEEIDALIEWADVIFVGGGNTAYMLEEWRKIGLQEKLLKVYREDSAVLGGLSAGAVCWFGEVYTDSDSFLGLPDWSYRMMKPGLDLYGEVICPHYDDPGRESFDQAMEAEKRNGIALENCTAFVDNQGKIGYIKSKEDAHAWYFEKKDGRTLKTMMV